MVHSAWKCLMDQQGKNHWLRWINCQWLAAILKPIHQNNMWLSPSPTRKKHTSLPLFHSAVQTCRNTPRHHQGQGLSSLCGAATLWLWWSCAHSRTACLQTKNMPPKYIYSCVKSKTASITCGSSFWNNTSHAQHSTHLEAASRTWGSCSHFFRASTHFVLRWGLGSMKIASAHNVPELEHSCIAVNPNKSHTASCRLPGAASVTPNGSRSSIKNKFKAFSRSKSGSNVGSFTKLWRWR